jgi:hypothetical protein
MNRLPPPGLLAFQARPGSASGISSPPAARPAPPIATALPPAPGPPFILTELPAALRPTFSAYPLLPGSAWTWRFTSEYGYTRWVAAVITETVESAWLDGEVAVVRTVVDVDRLTPRRNETGQFWDTIPGSALRYVSRHAIAHSRDAALKSLPAWAWTPDPGSPFGAAGVAPEAFMPLIPLSNDETAATEIHEGPATITTAAGRFEGCWNVYHVGGAIWGSGRWFCPGVGPVLYEAGGNSFSAVAELIRWQRAALPAP